MLPTARFDEHRLSKNTMGLVCALGEQRKLPRLPIHYFGEPSSDSALRFYLSLEQKAVIHLYDPSCAQRKPTDGPQ